jgi:hypothetical protein
MLRWTKGKRESEAVSPPPVTPAIPPPPARPAAEAPAAMPEITPPPQKSLPETLLAQGQVTREQLEQALARQKETGQFIGEILIEQGAIDENSLLSFLAKFCKVPHLSLLDYLIDKDIAGLIPREVCMKYRLLPIDKIGRNLTVAMVNPLNAEALQKIRELCPDLRIKPILCAHHHFEVVAGRLFKTEKTGGMVELSATSLGFARDPKPKPAPAPEPPAAPVPAPEPRYAPPAIPDNAEDYPEAVEVFPEPESPDNEAVATPPAPPDERDAVLTEVFHPAPPAEAVAEETAPDAQASALVKEMASVMMDSMRGTYAMLARRMELFRGLTPEDVARIFARGITLEYAPGAVIFEKGQPADKMYVILGGEIEVFDGDRVLATLRRGDMVGEMAAMTRQPRSAGARASETTSALALSLDIIRNAIPPEVALKLLTNIVITLSARLRHINETWTPPREG